MKKILIVLFTAFIFFGMNSPVHGQMADINEVYTVADNWIKLIVTEKGSWNTYKTASLEPMVEFKRNGRLLGYYFPVNPSGFILVSQRKELAPVKAYSARSNLDIYSDEGMTDLLKVSLERILDTIEEKLGPIDIVNTMDLENMVEVNYKQAWSNLLKSVPVSSINNKTSLISNNNYQEGQILLSSDWDQSPPYNDDCPWMNCMNTNGRALVGCVATAGAQIMHYWNWPPFGVGSPYADYYDWSNMPDNATINSPQAQINALAELNYEVGFAVGMSYGCNASGSYTYNMIGVYENKYRYDNSCVKRNRPSYTAIGWFEMLKVQFNQNRPVHYRIPGHSIVGDGWQELGNPVIRAYHMNYGWAGPGADIWYILDALQGGNPSSEYVLENIVPDQALGNWITGAYPKESFPYRYFDKDAIGYNALFSYGQNIQFLPNITLIGINSTLPIRFNGLTGVNNNTRLFTEGDITKGIRIYNGAIELTNYGSIRFR